MAGARAKGGPRPARRATGGALAACLIVASIAGFAGGAYIGSREDAGGAGATAGPSGTPSGGATTPGTTPTPVPEGLRLATETTTVAPGELIAISGGITPAEAGVEVQVRRRLDDGEWENFQVTFTTRDDGTFSGTLATGQAGVNAFKVVNLADDAMESNEISVTVAG